MNKKISSIESLRDRIDSVDRELVSLLNERGKISQEIGHYKKSINRAVYAPDREAMVYKGAVGKNKGPLKNDSIKAIYREIMSACLSVEKDLIIAFLGPELTFTHQAAVKKFGQSVKYLPCENISDVYTEVEKGNADYGVVPIENSTEGAVTHTMDMFVDSDLKICAEIFMRISHSILSSAKSLREIKKVYSHPSVFGQCRGWIEKNIPYARLEDVSSTVKAAQKAGKDHGAACIGSEWAASRYGLNILSRMIEDSSRNFTRFLVIGKEMGQPSGKDKTSLMFSVKDKPGVLHDMLGAFKKRGINLSRIESRPSKVKAWKYYFYLDLEGHSAEPKVQKALEDLNLNCIFVKVLGSYPKG
ncbi:MAG: prephenate dehydratase [Candidatus Omnitrophica bacterium]|nr:prephenate dehydratase [Candidatus Omnitrophota bacterium]